MSRSRWVVLVGAVVVTAVVDGALARSRGEAAPSPPASIALVDAASGAPSAIPSTQPSPEPMISSTPSPIASATPTPRPTTRPVATGDARLAYAEFLLRLDDDRATVTRLNQTLQETAEAGDRPAVRRASIDILDFADAEQDWLREHPPAACYADAHAAADSMLEAYAATADAFIAWADAGEGLDGLAAFGRALEAAGAAGDALTVLGRELEATTCLA
jgi:hypothetical protein